VKQKINITIDPALAEMVRQKAVEEERSFSQQITFLLKVAFGMLAVPVPPPAETLLEEVLLSPPEDYSERMRTATFDEPPTPDPDPPPPVEERQQWWEQR
jgi:hypothetical protein